LNPSTYIRRVNGKWRLRRDVSIIGVPRVVLSLKGSGFYKEFIFSTTNPEEVMKNY
jgi:predicted nucleic acid-binding Zn ribbon protein